MGGGPTIEQKSALDPSLSGLVYNGAGGPLQKMFDQGGIPAVGARTVLGESPREKMFRELGISNLESAIPGAGSMTGNESAASGFLGNTIRGDYLDPTQSPVYKTIADSILRKANESSMLAGDQLNANFAGAGHFGGSGPLLNARNDLAFRTGQGVSDTLASYLMPLYQQNLGYQQNALPLSMQFGNLQRNLPLSQLNLAQQAYGMAGVPRNIEQQQLDEMFAASQRARAAQIEPFSILTGMLGGTPPTNSVVNPSTLQNNMPWIQALTSMIGQMNEGRGTF